MRLFLIYLFLVCSTCLGRFLSPSSGVRNCSLLTASGIVNCNDRFKRVLIVWFTNSHNYHFFKTIIIVDNTRKCKYSYMLLMMGERIVRNMYSRLEINKPRIVASCWSSFIIIVFLIRVFYLPTDAQEFLQKEY
jgi:hypothetical protein